MLKECPHCSPMPLGWSLLPFELSHTSFISLGAVRQCHIPSGGSCQKWPIARRPSSSHILIYSVLIWPVASQGWSSTDPPLEVEVTESRARKQSRPMRPTGRPLGMPGCLKSREADQSPHRALRVSQQNKMWFPKEMTQQKVWHRFLLGLR